MKLPTFIVPIAVTGLYWSRGCFSAGKTKRTANLNPMAHRLSVPPFNISRPTSHDVGCRWHTGCSSKSVPPLMGSKERSEPYFGFHRSCRFAPLF